MPIQSRAATLVLVGGLLAATLPTSSAVAQQRADLVVSHVTVVDVATGQLLPDRDVVIRSDTIVAVGPATDAPRAATVVDGRGRYLIPGLWDMHAHLRVNGIPGWFVTDWLMPLLVAHGVTGVRDMNSDCESASQGPVCIDQMKAWATSIRPSRSA